MDKNQSEQDHKKPEANAGGDPKKIAPRSAPANEEKLPEGTNKAKPKEHENKADGISNTSQRSTVWARAWVWAKEDAKLTDWLIVVLTAVLAATSYLNGKKYIVAPSILTLWRKLQDNSPLLILSSFLLCKKNSKLLTVRGSRSKPWPLLH